MKKESRIEDQLQAINEGTGYSGKPMSRIEAQIQKIIENGPGSGGGGGGSSITVDSELSSTSTNPVQNAVITAKLNELENSIPDDITVDDELSEESKNPVQNKVVTEKLKELEESSHEEITVDNELSEDSENPVQNKVITEALKAIEDSIPEEITVDSELLSTSENPVQNKVVNERIAELDVSKANLNSPTFTGIPKAPTADIQANDLQIATTAFVKAVISALIGGAPETADTLQELFDLIENNEDAIGVLNSAIGNKVSRSGDSFVNDATEREMVINANGLVGDGTQKIESFYNVDSENIHGTRIYMNDDDIEDVFLKQDDAEETYLKKDDYTQIDTTNFLSTKKGGTVNNTFKVNKVSTTNPTGLIELDIHNDGKIAFNTSGDGSITNSLMHLSGEMFNGSIYAYPKKLRIETNVQSDSEIRLIGYDYFKLQKIPKINVGSNVHIYGEDIIIGYLNELYPDGPNPEIVFNDDHIFIHFANENPITENQIDIGYCDIIHIYASVIMIGKLDNYLIETHYSNDAKYIKLRSGTNANLTMDLYNNIIFGSEGGSFTFKCFDNPNNRDVELFNINNDGTIKIKNTNSDFVAHLTSDEIYIKDPVGMYDDVTFYIHLENYDGDDGSFSFYVSPEDFGLIPNFSGDKYLGKSYAKWTNIYATNGTIQTSDRNEKNTINDITIEQAKSIILNCIPKTYKMNEGSSGRTHWGLISQDIEEQLEDLGWSSLDFAGFIKSPKKIMIDKDENGNKLEHPIEQTIEGEYNYSLRYDEFIAPMIKVIQSHENKIKEQNETIQNQNVKIQSLEDRISALEALLSNS